MDNVERLGAAIAPVFGDGTTDFEQATIDRLTEALLPLAGPRLSGSMTGRGAAVQTFEGLDGMREIWADWLGVFARVRFEVESLEAVGDNVLMNARQIGTTRHGVDVEQPSAAVWKFRDDRIVRIEFHLDRTRAAESAAQPAS